MILAKRMLRDSSSQEGDNSTQDKKWPKMNVDEASIKDGQLVVRGWAISPAGILRIKVYVNDKFVGSCFYGALRHDVRRSYPLLLGSDLSGFSLRTPFIPINEGNVFLFRVVAIDRSGSVSVQECGPG
jgi:hypothetical protein